MKLIRCLQQGKICPGIVIDGLAYDLSPFGSDFDERFFESDGLTRLKLFVAANEGKLKRIPEPLALLPPVGRPSKIICVGLNYADHAKETNAEPPKEPVLFMKSTTAICGPFDDIIIPKDSKKTDWEVELAFVVGKKASYVDERNALEHVAGYCLHNDVSEREFQIERGGTWDKGKGCDTFAPLGPWLVTPDEIADVNNLKLWLKLNGKTVQNGTTANLIFRIPYLLAYISRFMTLLPGDIVSTGTPAGVGLGMNPQVYLKAGDVVELGIDGLGSSKQNVKAYKP